MPGSHSSYVEFISSRSHGDSNKKKDASYKHAKFLCSECRDKKNSLRIDRIQPIRICRRHSTLVPNPYLGLHQEISEWHRDDESVYSCITGCVCRMRRLLPRRFLVMGLAQLPNITRINGIVAYRTQLLDNNSHFYEAVEFHIQFDRDLL